MDSVAVFEQARPRLFTHAYRMLGSAADAQDAVQDAYLRWAGAPHAEIERPEAWLVKTLTNLCLNRLTSAAAKRESYVGQWLPEPVLTGPDGDVPGTVERSEAVSIAMLTLLERLTPSQRAVFVLRAAFGYPHAEIAELLGISEANSAQLYRRAQQLVRDQRTRFEPCDEQARAIAERFLDAAREGDVDGLTRLLAEDANSTADAGGYLPAARKRITGRDMVTRYLRGTFGRLGELPDPFLRFIETNGEITLLIGTGNRLLGTLGLSVLDGRITELHIQLNPEKLGYLAGQLGMTAFEPAELQQFVARFR